MLSHFDGSRPGAIEVTPDEDGTLQIAQLGQRVQSATTTRDPNERLTFSFPNPEGKQVSRRQGP